MDDVGFLREKLRREMQEVINELDAASIAEEGGDRDSRDAITTMRLIILGSVVSDYVDEVRKRIELRIEELSEDDDE